MLPALRAPDRRPRPRAAVAREPPAPELLGPPQGRLRQPCTAPGGVRGRRAALRVQVPGRRVTAGPGPERRVTPGPDPGRRSPRVQVPGRCHGRPWPPGWRSRGRPRGSDRGTDRAAIPGRGRGSPSGVVLSGPLPEVAVLMGRGPRGHSRGSRCPKVAVLDTWCSGRRSLRHGPEAGILGMRPWTRSRARPQDAVLAGRTGARSRVRPRGVMLDGVSGVATPGGSSSVVAPRSQILGSQP